MTAAENEQAPAIGAWVIRKSGPEREAHPGEVRRVIRTGEKTSITVRWLRSRQDEVLPLGSVECGLRAGFDVWHVPQSRFQTSLGLGRVMALRTIGGRQQILTDFSAKGLRAWIPWETLRFAKGPAFRFRHGDKGGERAAERFRLRNLAYALTLWNENTGSLSRFDIDPLPHQIHLVHHILSSGNLNWLIADDVGLGKTIEAGLLIAALRQRRAAKRILLVLPAGLTRQWQDDLKLKFGLRDFLIYGTDFQIFDNAHWKLYDHVIASMDKLKGENHLERILAAEPWDLIIFDEAHRLTRRQWGRKYVRSDRYRLAEALRERSPNLVLLTATPHQGRVEQFTALLELLRPETKEELANLEVDSRVLSRMVFRNRKSDVTDMEGNFVFHGQTSKMIQIENSSELRELERQLHHYFTAGYIAATRKGGKRGWAIGFVMTVYRKLAASSIITLRKALVRRIARLESLKTSDVAEEAELDERYAGEWEEAQPSPREEFFAGEIERLKTLVDECSAAAQHDDKMYAFLEKVIAPILQNDPTERVLIFSEYRGTQDYIVEELSKRYGAGNVGIVNGSMDVNERLRSIAIFEENGQFLVSTEAGGEGINLHRRCHVLVNFDLPWNPMRLAQRIGRLYRYGQTKHVLAFNLQGLRSADEMIVAKMYERLEQVAKDMASVDDSTSEALVADIVGDLASLIDVENILEESQSTGVQRTQERIDEALQRARESSDIQRKLFEHAASYDARALSGAFQVGPSHLQAFVFGMVKFLDGDVRETRKYPGRAWRLILPAQLATSIPGLGREPIVTFERALTYESDAINVLDMDHPLVHRLTELAVDYHFEGLSAVITLPEHDHVVTGMLRWQDGQGRRLRQEYVVATRHITGSKALNDPAFLGWLLEPADTCDLTLQSPVRNIEVEQDLDETLDYALASGSRQELHPENKEWLSAAWCDGNKLPD